MSALLRDRIYREVRPVDRILVAGPVDRISWEEAKLLEYRPLEPGERFGPRWATWWFKLETDVEGEHARFLWEAGGEAALWRDGRPLHGLDRQHHDAPLPGRRFEVELACYEDVAIERCEVALLDPEAWQLYWDFETLRALEAEADSGRGLGGPAARAELNRFCNELDPAILERALRAPQRHPAHELAAVGHAHLDTAWLWPLAETRRKPCARSATQLRCSTTTPSTASPARRRSTTRGSRSAARALARGSSAAVARGPFVPVGGTWVEPDCNIPVRRVARPPVPARAAVLRARVRPPLHGVLDPGRVRLHRRSCRRSCAAPASRASSRRSCPGTASPSPSTTRSRGRARRQRGAHALPAGRHLQRRGHGRASSARAARDYRDHDRSRTRCSCSATATAAAGRRAEMLETLRRARDLQGLPRTTQRTQERVLRRARGRARPTARSSSASCTSSTTAAPTRRRRAIKRGNRRCELALHDAELLAAVCAARYPREELDRLWQLAAAQPVPRHPAGLVDRRGLRGRRIATSPTSRGRRRDRGRRPIPADARQHARLRPREVADDADGEAALRRRRRRTGAGRSPIRRRASAVDGLTLENAHLRAELVARGSLLSLVERDTGREALAAPGNRLELYEDQPVAWDAWDIDPAHLETRAATARPRARVASSPRRPLRAEVAFERGSASRAAAADRPARRRARGGSSSARVDWHEAHRLLKVGFPLAVRADEATYEMPFGYAGGRRTSRRAADRRAYEVPGPPLGRPVRARLRRRAAHRLEVRLQRHGTSCGSACCARRASPDPDADRGRHEFAYALLPHAGGWQEGGVVAEAARSTRRCAGAPGARRCVVRGGRRPEPRARHDQARRGFGRAPAAALRGPRGARDGAPPARPAAPRRGARTCSRIPASRLPVDGTSIVVPYRPYEIVTILAG